MSEQTKPARRYLDVRGAAAFLGVTEYSIRWYIRRAKIPHRKLGAKILFDPQELERRRRERIDGYPAPATINCRCSVRWIEPAGSTPDA